MIREIILEDAEKLANLIKQVESESEYMLFEASERKTTAQQIEKWIESIQKEDNSTIWIAENEGRLIGYLFAVGGKARRTKHSVYIVIGILKEHRGKGIGTMLFHSLEDWAKEHNIHRLELTVVSRNQAGLALYKKAGFEIEGTKRNSLLINGEYVDEYYMSKLLVNN